MTDLPPQKLGQMDEITFTDIDRERVIPQMLGHWYSPAAVARMIEEARREERDECAKICDRYAIALDYSGNEYTQSREAELCANLIRKRGEK